MTGGILHNLLLCKLDYDFLLLNLFVLRFKADDQTLERLAGLDGINYDGEFKIREGKRASHVKVLSEVRHCFVSIA